MNLLQMIIQSDFFPAIAGGIGGVITAWLTQRVISKSGIFTYFVNHLRVGMSTEDVIFGRVAVSWNGNPILNLFLSRLELKNESMNDYENVVIRVYTSDTLLLSEQTQILDSPNILEWSADYKKQVHIESGQEPTEQQRAIYHGQREYIIPIMNRGQSVRLTYLNSAKVQSNETPKIWLSIFQKGVKLKFRNFQNQIFGVPQPRAAFVGVIIGVAVVIALVLSVQNNWVVAISALAYGLIAQIPGAYTIKFLQRIREIIGG